MPRRPTRYFPDYGPFLPTSGPDWRFVRAEQLVDSGCNAAVNRDGPEIIRAMKYLRARNRNFTGRWRRVLKNDPDLVEAVRFRSGQWLRSLELHCRVLARQSLGAIAEEMGLARSTVQAYCDFFFDVADKLDRRQYILFRVGILSSKLDLNFGKIVEH